MPRYQVQDTAIFHGNRGEKTATLYQPGEIIELDEDQAERLGANVVAVAEEKEPDGKPDKKAKGKAGEGD